MAGSGNTQIINGKEYVMYSPEWYDAQHAEAQRKAAAVGTAAGTTAGAAAKAQSEFSGAFTTGTPGAASGGSGPATIPPPSLTGLQSSIAPPTVGGTSGNGGGATAAAHAHLAPVDTTAAEAASFAKAKDQVGQEATGALTGLRSALGGRGLLGGGTESRATAAAATSAAGQLGDVSRQQAVTRAEEAQKNAAANFQGEVTQRGQDFQHEEAANTLAGQLALGTYSGQITQRGQDIQAANAAKALELEQAQLGAQQRSTALAGLEAALKVSPGGMMY